MTQAFNHPCWQNCHHIRQNAKIKALQRREFVSSCHQKLKQHSQQSTPAELNNVNRKKKELPTNWSSENVYLRDNASSDKDATRLQHEPSYAKYCELALGCGSLLGGGNPPRVFPPPLWFLEL